MSKENLEEKGFVSIRFIIFLKTTLSKMVATNILDQDFLDVHFWQLWPKKFYNIRCYDSTKHDFMKTYKVVQPVFQPSEHAPEPGENDTGSRDQVNDINLYLEQSPAQLPDIEDGLDSPSILVL